MSNWSNLMETRPHPFHCGHCGYNVSSALGYGSQFTLAFISICPHCDKPTFFDLHNNAQVPGVVPGSQVKHLPETLESLYGEARNCCGVGAYTASVLASRKQLMNIAVSQGATEGLRFIDYIEYLEKNGFIPPNGRGWVDHIRKKGNEATHEIALMTQADAEELITFSEMLLKFIYEFPARIPAAP
jgi:hypothetical protein